METTIAVFPPENYPTRELLEPLMLEAELGKLPEDWAGKSEALFMPEMLVELMKFNGSTNILYKNEVAIVSEKVREVKFTHYFYTRWAGVDNKTESLIFRLINLLGKQPKYLVEDEWKPLTIEEKYYYAILVRLLFNSRKISATGSYAPTYSLLHILWQDNYGGQAVPSIQSVKDMLFYDEALFGGDYFIDNITSNDYEEGLELSLFDSVPTVLSIWELGIVPSRIKTLYALGFTYKDMLKDGDIVPEEWYEALA